VQVAEHVGLDHPAPGVARQVLEPAEDADPGIVEPDVDPAEPLDGMAAQRLDLLLLGDVGRHGERRAAELDALALDLAQHLLAPGGEHDGGPAPGEGMGRGAADAARRTRDHHDQVIAR
jgi:hypothetical protein